MRRDSGGRWGRHGLRRRVLSGSLDFLAVPAIRMSRDPESLRRSAARRRHHPRPASVIDLASEGWVCAGAVDVMLAPQVADVRVAPLTATVATAKRS